MDGDPIRALTGRRRTRPTSPGCRNPRQPEPGRAPLSPAHAAVQTSRATSDPWSSTRVPERLEQTAENCWAATGEAARGKAIKAGMSERTAASLEAICRRVVTALNSLLRLNG